MVPEIDPQAFVEAHAADPLVVDVREPAEYVAGHVPGARLVPMSQVHASLGQFPTGEPVYVICASGNRSLTAADWLRSAGVEAISVAGGTGAWARSGRPVVRGPHPTDPTA